MAPTFIWHQANFQEPTRLHITADLLCLQHRHKVTELPHCAKRGGACIACCPPSSDAVPLSRGPGRAEAPPSIAVGVSREGPGHNT